MTVRERAAKVKLIAFDIDGVMTDGKLYYSDDGRELKAFNTLDGQGLRFLRQAGVELAIITGRDSGAVTARAKNLDIHHLFQGVADKHACMSALLARLDLDWSEAAYMGDDVVDLPTMQACAFSAAPDNAHPTVRAKADFVSAHRGGEGAVREVCDLLLAARQGKLHD